MPKGTRANCIEENRVAIAMVERVAARFDLKPKRLAADTAYGSGKTLRSLSDRGIEPHIPVVADNQIEKIASRGCSKLPSHHTLDLNSRYRLWEEHNTLGATAVVDQPAIGTSWVRKMGIRGRILGNPWRPLKTYT